MVRRPGSFRVILWLLVASTTVAARQNPAPHPASKPAQGSAPAAAPSAAKPAPIDPAKEADIRHLLDVTGGAALGKQAMDNMEQSMRPLMANALPPGDYKQKLLDLFFAKFHAKADVKALTDRIVPIYDKYLSDEDVKALINFYATPLGMKTLKVLPQVSLEAQNQGREWGQEIGRQCMQEVLSENPDLARALDAAQKTPSPH